MIEIAKSMDAVQELIESGQKGAAEAARLTEAMTGRSEQPEVEAAAIELVDTHAHLNDDKFADDVADAVKRAAANGVTRIINMGDTMESSANVVALSQEYDGLFAGVGVHPEEARPLTNADFDQLAEWAEIPKVVAIGEIGLDYYWEKDKDKQRLQQKIFVEQLDLARQLHLPVCIHDRDAHGDTLAILKKEGHGIRGVLHCYAGSLEMARELLKLGDWYFGFDGPLTFKNAARLPEVLRGLPLERVLVETDSPYMAPVPHRGKRNEPAFVREVAAKVAEFRGLSLEAVAKATTTNAQELYNKLY